MISGSLWTVSLSAKVDKNGLKTMTIITCVVDNNAQKDTDLRSEHGLSFWIETPGG